jgi:two-component system, chemotaxis family, sensor kinase CheA
MTKDRYKYFRVEARELLEGLSQGVLELERDSSNKDLVARILRLAHTLKGAARVVKQSAIADLAHALEGAFASYREGQISVPRDRIDEALALLDAISQHVTTLDLSPQDVKAVSAPSLREDLIETVRVEVEEVDKLLDSVAEAGIHTTTLHQATLDLAHAGQIVARLISDLDLRSTVTSNGGGSIMGRARARSSAEELQSQIERIERSLSSGIDQLQAEFRQVRDAANRLRLLPASAIFAGLERAVRDAAQALDKDVRFEGLGGNNRLDTHVLAGLRDALLHIVRNSVAHGIESRQQRAKAGKPPQGHIELRVERRGSQTAFICRDDGHGIDAESIRQAAIRRGVIEASTTASFGMDDAVRLILKGGVSTSAQVNELSGRGIGLDAVREMVMRLKGEVAVASERGKGTVVEICVPVSLSSLAVVGVEAGGAIAWLPQEAVREVLRLREQDIASSNERKSVVYQGKVIPFLPLADALNKEARKRYLQRKACSAVVIGASNGLVAVGVDGLLGANHVVTRPLPLLAKAEPFVVGASLDAEGNPQLVLDPEALVDQALLAISSRPSEFSSSRTPVLVVDDSLTTRMLEQNILESAGYEVDLATSGEEGLRKAAEKPYRLFLVDVEMPGMDGFEFVTRARADSNLHSTPSILVTSRSADTDRQRGVEVGARGYVVKAEFDQTRLLRMIEELLRAEEGEDARTHS